MRGIFHRAHRHVAVALLLALGLSACDDKSNAGSAGPAILTIPTNPAAPTPANRNPVANAGADRTVASAAAVSLTGTGTDPDGTIASFAWTQVSGTAVTLSNANTATVSFTAPTTTTNVALTFRLTVTDNRGGTNADDVIVNVTGTPTPTPNQNPTANAGPDQTVASAANVTLAGSGTDPDGTIASFAWTQTSGTTVTLSNASAANPTFTAPSQSSNVALGFRLTVTDNRGGTATDDVVINVTAAPATPNQNPTANAGPDQTVAAAASVTLAGSGTDPDGTIASFAWTQTSGTTVTLSNASAANPTFTAPSQSSNVALGFRLTVTDNRGGTATDDVVINVTAAPATPTTTTVSGRITYDRVPFKPGSGGLDLNNPVRKPARLITVQAVSTATPPSVLATAVTDANGNYSLTVPRSTTLLVRARAETIRTGTAPTWDFTVVDNTNSKALYVLDSASFDSGTTAQTRDLHAASGWGGTSYTGTRAAGPFAILDTIYDSFQKVLAVDATAVFSKLVTNWSVNNTNAGGNLPAGMIGTSFYTNSELYILGRANVDTDEFDDHIIVHEWGHYFEDKLSRSDSIGGEHSLGQLLDMRVAFGEGFGNALSGIVTDDPAYRDSSGANQASDFTINVESNPAAADNSGWYSEGSVQSILYDLYDATADGGDNLALGWGPLYRVFVGAQKTPALQTSIFTFITALKAANTASAAGIDAIVSGQRINSASIDDSGSQETNNGGNTSDVLPIYTAVTPNGPAQTVCSINSFGEPNKVSSRRFLTFTLGSTANLTVRVTAANTVDPDFVLYRRGQNSQTAASATAGSETLNAPGSAAGTYVVEAYDSANTDGNTSTGGRSCLNVTVTAN